MISRHNLQFHRPIENMSRYFIRRGEDYQHQTNYVIIPRMNMNKDKQVCNSVASCYINDKDLPKKMFLLSQPSPTKKILHQKSDSSVTTISSSTSFSASTNKIPKNVSFFDKIEIKEYPMELGDNPSACGIPIQIGWDSQRTLEYDLNEYEKGKVRRSNCEMVIPNAIRMALVERAGVTKHEIERILRENQKMQNTSVISIKRLNWSSLKKKLGSVQQKIRHGLQR